MSTVAIVALMWLTFGSTVWAGLFANGCISDCWHNVSKTGTAIVSVLVVIFWPIAALAFAAGLRTKETP